MKPDDKIRRDIREFIVNNYLMGDIAMLPADNASYLENGTIDSTGILELIMFLESHFGIRIEDRELLPENLDSLNNQVNFVLRKLSAA